MGERASEASLCALHSERVAGSASSMQFGWNVTCAQITAPFT